MPRPVLLIAGGSPGIGAATTELVGTRQAGEVAETTLFLLSDAASYVTGALLNVTRGR
jgi:NAD(P)-dependent dehydrogenase (short-subunit alcohol dehydrogenase family)